MKQLYHQETGQLAGDGGTLKHGAPGSERRNAIEAESPYTNSNHSKNKMKKPFGAGAHTKPEGGNPQVCHLCKGEGCKQCSKGQSVIDIRMDGSDPRREYIGYSKLRELLQIFTIRIGWYGNR